MSTNKFTYPISPTS